MRIHEAPKALIAVGLLVTLTAAGCQNGVSKTTTKSQSTGTAGYTLQLQAAPLPPEPEYSIPTLLAGDPSGEGVWYWTETASESFLRHVDGSSLQTATFSLGTSEAARANSGTGAIAVAPNGNVWVGIGSSVFELIPSTGVVKQFGIPSAVVIDNPAAEKYRPPEIQGIHGVQALAVSPSGNEVAIGLSGANDVVLFNDSTGFQSSSLPPNTEPSSVAFTDETHIAVGLNDYATNASTGVVEGAVFGLTQSGVVNVPDARSIRMVGSSLVVGDGAPDLLAGTGTASPTSTALFNGSVSTFTHGLYAVSSDRVVLVANNQLSIGSIGQNQIIGEVPIPPASGVCAPSSRPPGGTGESAQSSRTCPNAPTAAASDGAGDTWLIGPASGYVSVLRPPS